MPVNRINSNILNSPPTFNQYSRFANDSCYRMRNPIRKLYPRIIVPNFKEKMRQNIRSLTNFNNVNNGLTSLSSKGEFPSPAINNRQMSHDVSLSFKDAILKSSF